MVAAAAAATTGRLFPDDYDHSIAWPTMNIDVHLNFILKPIMFLTYLRFLEAVLPDAQR